MPRRRSAQAITLTMHCQWTRHAIWLCAVAVFLVALLAVPISSESAQQRTGSGTSSSTQKQKPSTKPKPKTPAARTEVQERGIVNTDVPEFKADTPAIALVIGISSYPNLQANAQLRFAHSDAQAMRDFLVSEKGGFRQEDVTLLLNEQATQDQIMREIGRLQERTGPSSLALIFFAGHGVVNKAGQAFLVASDTRADDLFATGIDMTLLNSTVQKMRARSVVIITDACHSGALGESLKAGPVTNVSAKYFDQPSQRLDQSSFIFSAASPTQASVEDSDLKGGLFTHFTLEGLNGAADDNNDGVVTSQELYNHVVRTMNVETRNRNIAQVPEHNPSYDRSIPLGIVAEAGRAKYKQWFNEDARFAFLLAAFNEALEENRLTRPPDQSAWDYLTKLTNNPGTPVGVAKEKEDQFLRKVTVEADKVIAESPLDSEMWEEAASNLERAFDLKRDATVHAKQYFCDVMALRARGEIARAERKCDLTLDLIEREGTTDHSITIKIGQFYREQKRWEKAGRAYRLANNKSASEITEFADVLTKLDSYTEAEEQLRQALAKNADYRPALIMLGDLLLRNPTKERVAEVLTHSTHALRLAPEDLDAEEVFGRANLAIQDTQRAIGSFTKVARLRPRGEIRNRALRYLSESYWRTGDLDRAISALREAEESKSQDPEVYDMLAAQLDERGNVYESIASAEKAASFTVGKPDHAQRVHRIAEYVERAGQLENAAFKYREAAGLTSDSRLRTAWETHAKVLFLRSGRNAEANVPRPASIREREAEWQSSSLNIPGGLDALKQLTGLTIAVDDKSALARVFDACLRDPAMGRRLVDFYSDFPDFSRKLGKEGDVLSGTLTLPAPNQQPSVYALQALKFFGVNDKKGVRQIKTSEFESRRYILEALGGDSAKLKNGEPVRITIRSGELPLVHGFDNWVSVLKDGPKIKPDEQLLAFLKNPQVMRLYVGLSLLPEEAVRDLRTEAFRTKQAELAEAMYFAAPYLRFDPRGKLIIPGGGPGESNWREALNSPSLLELMRALLFEKENRGALYLFCALSSAGHVGDAIAGTRKSSFDLVFNLFKKSTTLVAREPFDFIDLLGHLRIEDDQLRLPRVIELWQKSGDSVIKLFSQLGKVSAGGQIPLVKQIAVLSQIERERPDWALNRDVVDRIAALTTANKESQLETALDLEMSAEQLINYLDLIERVDTLPATPARSTAIRSFQATFELLRHLARNSSVAPARIADLSNRALQLDPIRNDYSLQLISFLRSDVLGADARSSGSEIETRLVAALAHRAPLELPSLNTNGTDASLLDTSEPARAQMSQFLAEQKVTRLASVFEAISALDDLDKNPAATESLVKLKAAVEEFVDAEPQVDVKKKKAKAPAVPEVTLKVAVAQITGPSERSTISGIRDRIAPYGSEALLAQVYAISAYPKAEGITFKPDLTRSHDFGSLPWSATRLGSDGRISGNLARLDQALARLSKTPPTPGAQRSAFEEAMLNSLQLIERRLVTRNAEEFVARTIDLGEDVLALYKQGDESAAAALNQLDLLMSQRRSIMVRTLVDRADILAATRAMTASELYALGRIYFDKQMATVPLETLRNEPGSLGVLAKAISSYRTGREKEISYNLLREIAQFGMSTSAVTGLNRLGLIRPEPYEYAAGFREDRRLAERVQDLKLALTRKAHRLGGGAIFPVDLAIADTILSNTMAQIRKASRSIPLPERDWPSLIAAIQALSDEEFVALVNQIGKVGPLRPARRNGWNDPLPGDRVVGVDAKPEE
jgi:tetratricopeptide (TPR) repeat protein